MDGCVHDLHRSATGVADEAKTVLLRLHDVLPNTRGLSLRCDNLPSYREQTKERNLRSKSHHTNRRSHSCLWQRLRSGKHSILWTTFRLLSRHWRVDPLYLPRSGRFTADLSVPSKKSCQSAPVTSGSRGQNPKIGSKSNPSKYQTKFSLKCETNRLVAHYLPFVLAHMGAVSIENTLSCENACILPVQCI